MINNENELFRRMNRSDFVGPVYLGSSLDQTGILNFFNSSSINATTFQAGIATAAVTYTLPTAAPAGNNYLLGSSTAGIMSWINAPGTYAPIGSAFVTIGSDSTLTAERALTGTTNQVIITDNGANSTVVLSTPQNIDSTATPTFASETLTAISNQLTLGTTRTVTLTAPTPSVSSRTITFPDLSGNYNLIGDTGTQTIGGAKTFSSAIAISATSNHLALSTSSNTLTVSAAAQATSARTWTVPDISGNGTFAALEGTQTISGSKTFSSDTVFSADVYTVAYVDYSGTSTIVGWSGFNSKSIYYKKIGKTVWVWFNIDGTSNATNITFTLPFTAANTIELWASCRAFNNGADQAAPGLMQISPNTATANCFKDWTSAVWTNSGRKIVTGQFSYQTT